MKPVKNGNYFQTSEDLKIIQDAQQKLSALNHDLRQKILKLLGAKGRLTVTEVYVKMRLEQSVASQHLAILRRAGFVKTEREGKFIYYEVDEKQITSTTGKAKTI